MIYVPAPRHRFPDACVTPFHDVSIGLKMLAVSAAASATWGTGSLALFYPLAMPEPYPVAKAYWLSGATVGTDSVDIGVYRMTDMTTGRMDLIRSTGAVLSAGSANVVQETATWRPGVNNVALTSGNDSTDSTTYTTASVTLKAGRLYLFSISNTAASAGAVSSIAGGPTWAIADGTNGTTQYNGTAHRVSVWYGVPTVDYTGTIVVTYGATQTGATWAVNEFSGVDTTTNGGIVQMVKGTGTSTTPLATLAAVGSANNVCFGALSNVSDTTTTPGAGFTELSDTAAATPSNCLQTEWALNDTTVDGTITSAAWGAIAVEIKADTSTFVIPASMPGVPDLYMAMAINGTTATVFSRPLGIYNGRQAGCFEKTSTFPLPSNVTPVVQSAARVTPLAGFSTRTLIG